MDRCWILIGMMGAGKSAIGRALAATTGREFIDTDQLLQHKLGRPITQIFQIYGEDAFREHESCTLRDLEPGSSIISTGGGIILREDNWTQMRRLGVTIYLDAHPDLLIRHLSTSKKKRPLLLIENWEDRVREILNSRLDLYRQAEVHVTVDGDSIDETAKRIILAMEARDQ